VLVVLALAKIRAAAQEVDGLVVVVVGAALSVSCHALRTMHIRMQRFSRVRNEPAHR
jgi:hypothetical protein